MESARPLEDQRASAGVQRLGDDRPAERAHVLRTPDDDARRVGNLIDGPRHEIFLGEVREAFDLNRFRHDAHRRVGIHQSRARDRTGDRWHRRHGRVRRPDGSAGEQQDRNGGHDEARVVNRGERSPIVMVSSSRAHCDTAPYRPTAPASPRAPRRRPHRFGRLDAASEGAGFHAYGSRRAPGGRRPRQRPNQRSNEFSRRNIANSSSRTSRHSLHDSLPPGGSRRWSDALRSSSSSFTRSASSARTQNSAAPSPEARTRCSVPRRRDPGDRRL